MSLTVRNAQRVIFTLNLHHETKVDESSPYAPRKFTMETVAEARAGQEAGTRLIEKTLPGSITWLPGETLRDLPEGITQLEEFQRARSTRKLVLVEGGDVKKGASARTPGEPKRYDRAPVEKPPDPGAPVTTSHRSGDKA